MPTGVGSRYPSAATAGVGAEPIAIIGIGCRFPGGADSPEAFWELLCDGVDAITPVPPDRWGLSIYEPGVLARGKGPAQWGGFLDLKAIEAFDAYFFGVSPREAGSMDPQQRLLLEVAWEALEDAGQVAANLHGSRTGVFLGLSSCDYENIRTAERAPIDIYSLIGSARSVHAGRLSYAYGLEGPSLVTDTACSSSLVACHLASQSLRNRECALALAAGVNLVLLPELSSGFNQADMMAPDGRCKAFDARADGFVRSEGVAVVVLKRLSEAVADGDPIYAVIRGSAVNNDGRSSGLLITPGQRGQEAVLREAYRHAGVLPGHVQYVEAHGTGTSVGDPVEARALGRVIADGRPPDRPCLVGSVKTNIGHAEATAGLAGLIKVALALKHEQIPASLHCQEPSPHIPWQELPLRVQREHTPWPSNGTPRIAGVSSFGIGGTNAHVVLQEAPRTPAETGETAATRSWLLPISAKVPEALRSLAAAYREQVAARSGADQPSLSDVCYTAGVRRTHHDHRLAVAFDSRAELADKLDAFLRQERVAGLAVGHAGARPKVAFVFPGQGGQWLGMGRELLDREPVFRAALERCEQAMRQWVDWSLLEQLAADEATSRLDQIDVVQPAIFAIQVGLAELWRSWGVGPDAVIGHSMGEVAAAHVAGALSLEDATRIICRRSRLLRRISGLGAMATVGLAMDATQQVLAGYEDRVSVAASNGPTSTVLSGAADALQAILVALEARGVFCRRVDVDVAAHSPQTEALLPELAEALAGLQPCAAAVPIYSTVTGEPIDGAALDAGYWARNLRERVLFTRALERLARADHTVFLELSPHPILLGSIQEALQALGQDALCLPSLRRGAEQSVLLGSLGTLYAADLSIDWRRVYPHGGRCVRLPAYAWQRERFPIRGQEPAAGRRARRAARGSHPLLGEHFTSAIQAGVHQWEMDLSPELLPYLTDHQVQDHAVLPAAAYVEMVLAAAAEAFGPGPHTLEDVALKKALFLSEHTPPTVQLVLSPGLSGTASFQLYSRLAGAASDDPWTLHASGVIRLGQADPATHGADPATNGAVHASPEAIRARCTDVVPGPLHYQAMHDLGLQYGPSFQGVEQVWRRDGEAIARLRLPALTTREAGQYQVHPTLLDSALQVLVHAAPAEAIGGGQRATYLPVGIDRVRVRACPEGELWSHALLRPGATPDGDVYLLRQDGQVVLEARGVHLQRLEPVAQAGAQTSVADWLYELRWERRPRDGSPEAPERSSTWLVFADAGTLGASLGVRLEALGQRVVFVRPGAAYERVGPRQFQVDPAQPEDFRRLLREAVEADQPPCRGIVHLWSLDTVRPEATSADSLDAGTLLGCGSTLHLVQALAGADSGHPPQLWLVTAGVHPVGAARTSTAVAQAPLWGLGRVVFHEHPELRCRLVDLAGLDGATELESLLQELWSSEPENQVVLAGGERYVARLARAPADPIQAPSPNTRWLEPTADQPFQLETAAPGVLDNLRLGPVERRRPGRGEVEIAVRAAGLNFSDVMKAMGIYPGQPEGVLPLGIECSGVVTAVGEGVEAFGIGDEVMAATPYPASSFGAYVTVPVTFVMRKPARLTFEEAATMPIAFSTAWYALHHVGKLRAGERVLIHAAGGGVGLAAVELAQRAGAEIFATAGSPEKRARLESLGIRHVMDSRSLAFAEQVLERTGGRGVDVVLNSLAGEAIAHGLAALAPGGRFLEIGKRDIYQNTSIGLLPFRKGISFHAIDMDLIIRERPRRMAKLLREVAALSSDESRRRVRPLPYSLFPISDAVSAFRCMAQAKHFGKIVLSLDDPKARPARAADRPVSFRADGAYLITGGLGGLGLSVARWMVQQGARNLVLLGRHRPARAAAAVTELRRAGARVLVAQADVADMAQLRQVLARARRRLPPLRGVVHAAGVLDDGILLQLTYDRFGPVLAPKVRGAWNLHCLTADAPLDFFVLFSSAASLIGSPGQANYSAANAFLDALAHHRRLQGQPALSINWGPWGEVGLAARPDRGGRLEQRGLASLTPRQGVEALGALIRNGAVNAAVMRANWSEWRKFNPAAVESPLLAELVRAQTSADGSAATAADSAARSAILAVPPAQRQAAMEAYLADQIARVLGLPASRVSSLDPQQQLDRLGLDSLMAVELKNRIETELGARIPVTKLLQGPSIAQLGGELLEQLVAVPAAPRVPAPEQPPGDPNGTGLDGQAGELLARVDQLPDAEVEALLQAMLPAERSAR